MADTHETTPPAPLPAIPKYGCVEHIWTQLTPEKAQCGLCALIVPTVPDKNA